MAPEGEQIAHMLFAPGFKRAFATHPSLEERLKELNPNFRVAELPALAAAAARDAQRMQQLAAAPTPAAEPPGNAASAAMPQATLASSAALIAAQAGTIADARVRDCRARTHGNS